MKKFDWEQPIHKTTFMLHLIGLWPPGSNCYKSIFYTIYATLLGFLALSHVVFQAISNVFLFGDLEALTDTLFFTLSECLITLKAYFFVLNLKVIKNLLLSLNSDNFQPKTEKQVIRAQLELNTYRKINYVYRSVVIASGVFWCAIPLSDRKVNLYGLPFNIWYPYKVGLSPFYELTYLYQFVSILYIAIANVGVDMMVGALMIYICTQCIMLCDTLKKAESRKSDVINKISACVNHHKDILRFAQESNTFFSVVALGQLFISTVAIALTMFQLTLVDPFSSQGIVRIMCASGIATQLFIYCWFGNEVEFEVRC
ncbi:hypothetical protein Zmor_007612 [Zophobas morio]|uniref:Odorant receptor n=1 Tax=Zophobas morio TaxID=2755281 RepID=A0AA38IXM7_9CUCU|nr:hypothetical protein Zmor_007612 [Zophobas morio]